MSEGTGSKPWDADMEYNNLRIAHDQLFDKVIALRAENTRLRGILRDLAGCEDQDLIKGHVVMSTLEVDALRAEVERLNGRFDTANQVIAHRENECAMLRAEVAALQADCRTLETAKADAEALAMSYEGTAERLQAELAKRDEPLRPALAAFALAMEAKLKANDHKGGWAGCDEHWLMDRLYEEADELCDAINKGDPEAVAPEAADVANFAMMIYDAAIRRVRRGE